MTDFPRKEIEEHLKWWDALGNPYDANEIRWLRSCLDEIDRLREALEPFAKLGGDWANDLLDDKAEMQVDVTMGDLRRAHQALKGK